MLRAHYAWVTESGLGIARDGSPAPTASTRQDGPQKLEALAAALAVRQPTRYERWVKPLMDRAVAAILIIALTPVLLMLAGIVLVAIGRPILFGQVRAGHRGKPFAMLKFRTMLPDRRVSSADYTGPERRVTHKTRNDPRHTPVGRYMRKLSLDELPQLYNVLRGQMSLVGPRPELIEMTADYREWQRSRQLVKPGLTGLWQTTERGHGLPLHECIDLDLRYIDRLTFRTDLGIILRTPIALLRTREVI